MCLERGSSSPVLDRPHSLPLGSAPVSSTHPFSPHNSLSSLLCPFPASPDPSCSFYSFRHCYHQLLTLFSSFPSHHSLTEVLSVAISSSIHSSIYSFICPSSIFPAIHSSTHPTRVHWASPSCRNWGCTERKQSLYPRSSHSSEGHR